MVHEGNIRRINIKNEDGKTLIEVPLTLGVVCAMLRSEKSLKIGPENCDFRDFSSLRSSK